MGPFKVIKRNARGEDELAYGGRLREREDEFVCIDAIFDFPDRDLGYMHLRRGDHFREWFYAERWYNIFRVCAVESLELKGWYCNITRPPVIGPAQVVAEDLGLDVFVYPDGRTLLLDEDDFARLNLLPLEEKEAWQAVESIKTMVEKRLPPFDEILG